jgi:hypothetical protein
LPIRLLKDPAFDRWARKEQITDSMLRVAADEIENGLIGARLGGFLLKKRVARLGGGKRGGYRTIVAYRQGNRLIFLHGFAKNDADNVNRRELLVLGKLGDQYLAYDDATIRRLVAAQLLIEVE